MDISVSYENISNENGGNKTVILENGLPDWDMLFKIYYKRIYNYCYIRSGNQHAAEDITGSVFEKLLAKYSYFNEGKAPLEVWIFAVARNTVNDYFRKNKCRAENIIAFDTETEYEIYPKFIMDKQEYDFNPEQAAIKNEDICFLIAALSKLKDGERNIIALKYACGLKNTEIARVTGKTASNVSVVLLRVLRKLKKELTKEAE